MDGKYIYLCLIIGFSGSQEKLELNPAVIGQRWGYNHSHSYSHTKTVQTNSEQLKLSVQGVLNGDGATLSGTTELGDLNL